MIVPLTVRGCDKNTPPRALSPAPGVVNQLLEKSGDPLRGRVEREESEREILPQASELGVISWDLFVRPADRARALPVLPA